MKGIIKRVMKKKSPPQHVLVEYTGNGQHVSKKVTHLRFHPDVTEVKEGAFKQCKRLREVVLNEGLQRIGKEAFYWCKELERIELPSTVTDIDEFAFYNCVSLREVVLNEGLQSIGKGAFYVEKEGAFNFRGCSSLESIVFPSTLTEIGVLAFSHSSLKEIVLNEGLTDLSAAFLSCLSLKSVIIPTTIDELDEALFMGCTNLSEVVLKEGLRKIGKFSFYSCHSLKSISIPSTVTEIAEWAFCCCYQLKEVAILQLHGNINFGNNAFRDCRSLERFTFPELSLRLESIAHWIPGLDYELSASVTSDMTRFVDSDDEDEVTINDIWVTVIKPQLNQTFRIISYYEMKEATSLLELALWKSRIDRNSDENKRDAYRIEIPGPIKDAIKQYLGFNNHVSYRGNRLSNVPQIHHWRGVLFVGFFP